MTSTASTIHIRRLGPADAEVFRAVRLEALTAAPEAFGSSPEEESARSVDVLRSRLTDTSPDAVFGAFADGALIGIAGFMLSLGIKKRHKGVLWGVFVHSQWRSRGVGERLVRTVIHHATDHVLTLQAAVVTSNATARNIYHRLGFVAYGVEPRALRVGDVFHDEEMLMLELSARPRGETP
jgi:ribosomal protein S18 acetylase RimI-like enzyme